MRAFWDFETWKMDRAFSPLCLRGTRTWGVASGWYGVALSGVSRAGLTAVMAISLVSGVVTGCKSGPESKRAEMQKAPAKAAVIYPSRPSVTPPAFKVFHHDASTITLVTKEDATDEEIESLIWELRDAAHARTLDALNVSQKMVDERKPIVWFHIYRGSKCASEKYADGPPPCGGSYHAAGDFTYGGYKNKEADSGSIFHGEDHETQLWDAEKVYVRGS